MTSAELLDLWYQALASPLGIKVSTPDPHQAKVALYAARKKAQDPSLDCLALHPSPQDPKGELWLVKRAEQVKKEHLNGSRDQGQVLDIDLS